MYLDAKIFPIFEIIHIVNYLKNIKSNIKFELSLTINENLHQTKKKCLLKHTLVTTIFMDFFSKDNKLVCWRCRIHCASLQRDNKPAMCVLDMILNNLMVRHQKCWSFGECGMPFHCHRSRVHSGPEW